MALLKFIITVGLGALAGYYISQEGRKRYNNEPLTFVAGVTAGVITREVLKRILP